jgi:hypothetical protein
MSILEDSYGEYTPSAPMPRVPAFPCEEDSDCTQSHRMCEGHRRVLFVKLMPERKWEQILNSTGNRLTDQIEIPYGNWENFTWYGHRISEVIGLPNDNQHFCMIYAGCTRWGIQRHSGLQVGAQIICCLLKRNDSAS